MIQVAIAIALDGRVGATLGLGQKLLARDRLNALLGAQLTIVAIGVIIPDMHTVAHQVADVRIARQEPQQFVDHALQEDLFGGEQRESLAQIEAHLVAENALCACTCAVALHCALVDNAAQQIEICFHIAYWLLNCFNVKLPSASITP